MTRNLKQEFSKRILEKEMMEGKIADLGDDSFQANVHASHHLDAPLSGIGFCGGMRGQREIGFGYVERNGA